MKDNPGLPHLSQYQGMPSSWRSAFDSSFECQPHAQRRTVLSSAECSCPFG